MFEPLAILWTDSHHALHGLSVHVQRDLLPSPFVLFYIHHCAIIAVGENDIDIDRGREENRHYC